MQSHLETLGDLGGCRNIHMFFSYFIFFSKDSLRFSVFARFSFVPTHMAQIPLTCICFIDMTDMTWHDVIQTDYEEAMNSWICWCVGTQKPLALHNSLISPVIRCHYQRTICELKSTVVPTSIKTHQCQQYKYQIFSLAKVRSRCRRVLRRETGWTWVLGKIHHLYLLLCRWRFPFFILSLFLLVGVRLRY